MKALDARVLIATKRAAARSRRKEAHDLKPNASSGEKDSRHLTAFQRGSEVWITAQFDGMLEVLETVVVPSTVGTSGCGKC